MSRVFVFVFCLQFFAGVAAAQWVSSGSGMGKREGDQGLTSPNALAQSIGYDSTEDMAEAAEQGYEANADDALAWEYASSGQFDEDCVALFGATCGDVEAEDFRPIVPQIVICIGLGFENLTEMGEYVDAVGNEGGDETDAGNCKARNYSSSDADAQLCMMATNDNENVEACRQALGAAAGADADCSDLDRDDYEDIANNMPPRIIVPADWMPSEVAAGAGQGSVLIDVLRAIDPDGDELTWSLAAADPPLFAINATDGTLSLSTGFGETVDGPTRPETAQLTVQVSDGKAADTLALNLAFADENGPPRIIVPADWMPRQIPNTASVGDTVISILRATDPDGDDLTWSIAAMDFDVFSIDATTGVVTIAEGGNAPAEQPDSVTVTVQVSDGELSDDLTVKLDLQDSNRPPQIVLPADWMPSIVPHDSQQGANLVDRLAATDPDGDDLTWSISSSDLDIFAINPQTGVLTLARENGLAGLAERPENVGIIVKVSDGQLTDEQALSIPLEAEKINNPPEIVVPEGFADNEFNPYANSATVGTLEGRDPDGDTLTWSLLDASPQIFNINARTGGISYSGLGANDKLSCEATNSDSAPAAPQGSGGVAYGILSTNGNVVEDHNMNDFRSKKTGGKQTTTNKYHVFLERFNHRGGSFTTEARDAQFYDVTGSNNLNVPQLRSVTVNSNVTPINSYLVYQNNAQVDFSSKEGVITFTNPIVGIYYTDNGFDNTITRLGKPGALYSRKSEQNKLALEGGRDIAWIDPVDSRKVRFRSRTANVGDFIRVITTASNTGTDDEDVSAAGPDECSATLTVQLSDGQATDEETLTLAFGDPNRAPEIIAPVDWEPALITNDKNANDRIVSVLASRDPDGDTVRWSLSGDNADLFSIDSLNGDIRLADNWNELGSRPTRATVTVNLTDGRLSATQEIDFNIEEEPMEGSMASNIGTNGSFQFVSGDVRNIFNQDYTIMARFFHGSGGYSDPYFDYNKRKWLKRDAKETIFFWGGNVKQPAVKFLSGISLHVVGDTIRLQLGSDGSYLETRASIQRNRWHTVMFVVDAEQRRKTKKHNWPVKMYLNGRRVGLTEFKTTSKNKGYKPIGTPEGYWPKQIGSYGNREADVENDNTPVAAIGVAGTVKPAGQNGMHWSIIQRRHLPLRSSSFIHEVSIWQGDKSSFASGIYNNNRDVADYASTSVGKPRYSWKPGLLGQSKTEVHCGNIGAYVNYMRGRYDCRGTPAGDDILEKHKDWTPSMFNQSDPKAFVIDRWKGTVTLANLANGANPENGKSDYFGPTAGNGTYRLDGDMHLYSGGFTFETEVYNRQFRKRFTGFVRAVPSNDAIDACDTGRTTRVSNLPIKAWHQGSTYNRLYFSGLKRWHGWSAHCLTFNDDDIKAFATRAMSGKTKPLN